MAKPDSWWNGSIRESPIARAIGILWIDKSGLVCKCGHLSDSHVHQALGDVKHD